MPPSRSFATPFTHLAAYQFGELKDLRELRVELTRLSKELELKGTILLSHEGINLFVAGTAEALASLLERIRLLPGFESFEGKYNPVDHQPYNRMLVRLKKEIISFGVDGIEPAKRTSPKLSATELKQWLDEGRRVTLLDTRNDYEIKLGTFKDALPIGIDTFREFPEAVRRLPEELKEEPIVMFCTGGIRCEKAGPFMEREGFQKVFQLDGGILRYFEECQDAHYDGECFVFDQRTSVDPSLQESDSAQCFRCQSPLSAEDQKDPRYEPGGSCPHCHHPPEEERAALRTKRMEALHRATHPLPGSEPYDNHRPITIPESCHGKPLLDALAEILPHVAREDWVDLWNQGDLLDDRFQPIPLDQPLAAGTRCLRRLPATVEPDVATEIEVLHEDEAIIVLAKPAPLPMHPGGRFNRNTLQYFLGRAFHPLKPRPAHRLDANTTGVVVFTTTRHFAGRLQPAFARGEVEKKYLVKVAGQPDRNDFDCNLSIAADAGPLGSRDVDSERGLKATTLFKVIRRLDDGTTLLEAIPTTGRTNQIRIHLWQLGMPVIGDPVYLPNGALGSTQTLTLEAPPMCLHAESLSFPHPLSGERVSFQAPPPAWFSADDAVRG